MQLLDLENLKIVESDDCQVLELNLQTENLLDKSIAAIDNYFYEALDGLFAGKGIQSPVYIKINLEDESFTAVDVDYTQQLILETVATYLLTNKVREREMRLSVPKDLDDVNLSYIKMIKLINEETLLNCFGIEAVVCGWSKSII